MILRFALGSIFATVLVAASLTVLRALTPSRRPTPIDGTPLARSSSSISRGRLVPAAPTTLASYRAEARGYVYFFVDRPDEPEHVLVKADQVALELFWRAPDQARQRLVGRRDEKVLPTSIRYHLDHLTVVQDDYGDLIRIGDGDEVSAVVAPPPLPARAPYTTSSCPTHSRSPMASKATRYGSTRSASAPRRWSAPAWSGSMFVDRDSGAIVRLNFSFTPSSYVDD